MKKTVVSIFAFFLVCTIVFGQEKPEHLCFKGIPIDGSMDSFCNTMSNFGLTKKASDGEISVLTGSFAGYKNCNFIVVSFWDEVWKVIVEFPERKTWASTKELYDRLKQSFVVKYDVFPVCVERMTHYAKAGTGLEYMGFQDETSKWSSTFDLSNGKIKLSVKAGEPSTKQMKVTLEYIDGQNSAFVEGSAMEDL